MAAASDSSGSSVRKRRVDSSKTETKSADSSEEHGAESSGDTEKEKRFASTQRGTYWLTRIVLLRAVAFIYFVAFSVAYNQNRQLIGENGLMPYWSDMDANLDGIALAGMALSAFVLVTGMANMVIMVTLWVLYHSLVSVGQLWYSFGWESQLLETGFLAIFLCPLWTLSQVPLRCPPSLICIWTFRWLIVRIMLGANATFGEVSLL
ncbi:Lipase maturation factor 1 [Collichthys lucidus]|uniref:Lipase maturation factor n=1 Tax=Collichthys lucidus TaxID=240159 RepID=A0A4U5VNR7_COLLU|nr:Lipase maturation factor 1 [Collichthys lucidus]